MVAIRAIPRHVIVSQGQTSVLHWLWRTTGAHISDLFDGETDSDDEAEILRSCLAAVDAGQLAQYIQSSEGWARLDDELESSAVTSISKHLARLFDERDYLPWRLTAGAFADGIVAGDRGAARYLLEVVPHNTWLTVCADLALRAQFAANIRTLPRLQDNDRAALHELELAAQRVSGDDDAMGVRGLFWFCNYVDIVFRATAVADVDTLLQTVTEIAAQTDRARRNAGLDALMALRDRTVAAIVMIAQAMQDGATLAGVNRIRSLLEAAAQVPQSGSDGALQAALARLVAAVNDLRQEVQAAAGAVTSVGQALENLRVLGSGRDEEALSALNALAAADLLKWLPLDWKSRLCSTLLLTDATGDDDEQMIIQVFKQSRTPAEFFHLHSGLGQEDLEGDIDGAENDRFYATLDAFTRKQMFSGG